MFKLEFDAHNKKLAEAIGRGLQALGKELEIYGGGGTQLVTIETDDDRKVGLVPDHAAGYGAPVEKEQEQFDAEVISGVGDSGGNEDLGAGRLGGAGGASSDDRVDDNGVRFNVAYCGEAQIPFYSSGKNKGQWKKKKGVEQSDYDTWYTQMLATAAPSDPEPEPEQVDTSAAFGGQSQEQEQPTDLTFNDAGQFMGWVAEQQTAGFIAQEDMDGAYQTTGIQIQDLFNPETAAEKIAELYAVLNKHIQEQKG